MRKRRRKRTEVRIAFWRTSWPLYGKWRGHTLATDLSLMCWCTSNLLTHCLHQYRKRALASCGRALSITLTAHPLWSEAAQIIRGKSWTMLISLREISALSEGRHWHILRHYRRHMRACTSCFLLWRADPGSSQVGRRASNSNPVISSAQHPGRSQSGLTLPWMRRVQSKHGKKDVLDWLSVMLIISRVFGSWLP